MVGFAPRGSVPALHKNRRGRGRMGRGAIRGSACATSSPGRPASSANVWSRPCWRGAAPSSISCSARKAQPSCRRCSTTGASRAPAASASLPVYGDLTAKKLGVAADDIKKLKGHVDHVYHLAAVYDLSADAESQIATNIEGTRAVVEFAKAIDAGHLHHVSSIAAAGLYEGRLSRGHVRRGRRPRPPVLHDQAREREDRAHGIEGAVDGVPARRSSSATRRPARWTRSTVRTTSSS